jgi:hypothetical protein
MAFFVEGMEVKKKGVGDQEDGNSVTNLFWFPGTFRLHLWIYRVHGNSFRLSLNLACDCLLHLKDVFGQG